MIDPTGSLAHGAHAWRRRGGSAEALDMFGIDKASWEDRAADKNVWKDMLVRGMNMALTKCKEHMLLHELYGI